MGEIFSRLDDKLNLLEILRKFRNFRKILLRKLRKMNDFSVFFKRFNELYGNILRLWTKMQCRKFFKDFSKNFKKFIRVIAKNASF